MEANCITAFRQAAFNKTFELEVFNAIKEKHIKTPTYLSLGTECIPAFILSHLGTDWKVFAQHRCHSWYLSLGGDPTALAKELLGREDGCNKGMGGSASISIPGKMYGHSGLLGDNLAIACGYAHATNNPTICVFGDAAAEEDYALASLGYAATHKLPILFICEDNNLSILTEKSVRRSWDLAEVAKGFGISVLERYDNELNFLSRDMLEKNKPQLFLVHCQRDCWHAGAGKDGSPSWDTYGYWKNIIDNNHRQLASTIEREAKQKAREIWEPLLKK